MIIFRSRRGRRPGSRHFGKTLSCSLAIVLLAVAGCARVQSDRTVLRGDFTGDGAGSLVSANVLPNISADISASTSLAARYTYVSDSGINNNPVKVTGTLLLPRGASPGDGWKTVALAHPMTGIQPQCGPSSSPDLLGLVPTVLPLLREGYAVTIPDYQGLGDTNARHPFLDSTTVGRNLIDSIRAAAKFSHLSKTWVAIGAGQGGQASWAANELMDEDGVGLKLLGTVSVSPFANLEKLVDAAESGTLTGAQKMVLVLYLAGLKEQFADFDLDVYRRGNAAKNWNTLVTCPTTQAQSSALDEVSADDLRPATPAAVEVLRNYLRKTELPQGKSAAPMMVTWADQDPVVAPKWTSAAVIKACEFGDTIQIDHRPEMNPASLDMTAIVAWINDRVNNVPAVNDCTNLAPTESE